MKPIPFLMAPSGKDYLWGGRRLKDDYNKNLDITPLAETWECSTHPDGNSCAASGPFCGKPLTEILQLHPEYLGRHANPEGQLPILIKLIDAKKDLSVQVHPTDRFAREHENGQLGKTEMWYILAAHPDASLIYGVNRECSRELLRRASCDGTIENYLRKVPAQKNNVFYIEAGMIHAIGAGIVLAEIQENSNLTYRLYDYDRLDMQGRKRELHVEKALEVAELLPRQNPRQPIRTLHYRPGMAVELLCRCRYFEVFRVLLNTERGQKVVIKSDAWTYRVLLCLGGCGALVAEGIGQQLFQKGDCYFFPADSVPVSLHGQGEFLDIRG